MLDCRDATGLMSQARERPLTARERLALGLHKVMCGGCRNFDRQLDVLTEASRLFAQRDDRVPVDENDPPSPR